MEETMQINLLNTIDVTEHNLGKMSEVCRNCNAVYFKIEIVDG